MVQLLPASCRSLRGGRATRLPFGHHPLHRRWNHLVRQSPRDTGSAFGVHDACVRSPCSAVAPSPGIGSVGCTKVSPPPGPSLMIVLSTAHRCPQPPNEGTLLPKCNGGRHVAVGNDIDVHRAPVGGRRVFDGDC